MMLGGCAIGRGFVIRRTIRIRVVVYAVDKIIPLVIIIVGLAVGLLLSNYKNKIFRSILILGPVFQKTRVFSVGGEIVKRVDRGFVEELGGPGIYGGLKVFFISFHPGIAMALMALFFIH